MSESLGAGLGVRNSDFPGRHEDFERNNQEVPHPHSHLTLSTQNVSQDTPSSLEYQQPELTKRHAISQECQRSNSSELLILCNAKRLRSQIHQLISASSFAQLLFQGLTCHQAHGRPTSLPQQVSPRVPTLVGSVSKDSVGPQSERFTLCIPCKALYLSKKRPKKS